jgi:uncharacterized tellurite resistance protein B-like protein
MATLEEKLSLLSEMISFAVIDGKLHDREYRFIVLIATELRIEKPLLDSLFQEEIMPQKLKTEFARIQQFYRLALLMHIDNVLHEKEYNSLHEIGISMGLNPAAMKKILVLMKNSPKRTISPKVLFDAFTMQHN